MNQRSIPVFVALLTAAIFCVGAAPASPVVAGQGAGPFPVTFPASPDGPQAPSVILAIAIDAGEEHACLINILNQVFCWGNNVAGQLGDGTTSDSLAPVRVVDLTEGAVAISAGGYHTCVVTTEGAAKCWGSATALGNGGWQSSPRPVQVSGLTSGVVDISAGRSHTCAVLDTGAARCWGAGQNGQLGNGLQTSSNVPITPTGLTANVAQIGAGEEHTCARMVGGGIKCWGANYYGQLATGNQNNSSVPVNTVPMGGSAVQLAAGSWGNCIRTAGGGAQCWGLRSIVGDGTNVCWNGDPWQTTPHWIANMTNSVTDISVGWAHACGVRNGGAWCWGYGGNGELGNGQTPSLDVCTPVGVVGLGAGVARMSAGKYYTLALLSAGGTSAGLLEDEFGVRAWGKNNAGQLGDGTTTPATTPVQVVQPAVQVYLPLVMR